MSHHKSPASYRRPAFKADGSWTEAPEPKEPGKPPVPAGDPEYERSQPVTRDDRRALLRRHFAAGGMSDAQIEAAMSKAKV